MDDANNDSGNRAYGCLLWATLTFAILVAVLVLSAPWAAHGNPVKFRLTKVTSTLDPFKTALEANYQKTHKPVLITTVLTQANSGGRVTQDWAALGFEIMPRLPREISSLRLTPEDDIVVILNGIGQGIDGTEVRAHALRDAQGTTWSYSCTSKDSLLKRYFGC